MRSATLSRSAGPWTAMFVSPAFVLLVAGLACARSGRNDLNTHQAPPGPAHEPIHNVIELAPGLISGSAPEGEAGFAALAQRGVRTVLSVDGAPPDVAAARRHGLRYVHFPVGYHGIDHQRQLEIARAVRDLPAPIYVHCHHGKHRGPAAAASAAVMLNELTVPQAIAFMKKAGTSNHYTGLYACVETAGPVSDAEFRSVSNDFPEVTPAPGFVQAMADAQSAYDHLTEVRDAGWTTPPDHPDLVPLAEAGRLENLLRGLLESPDLAGRPADFQAMMRDSWSAAQAFEDALTDRAPADELASRLRAVNDSCKACHVQYRDRR